MKHVSSLPNPSSLLEAMRDIGYSMETAVADIIDNSITAQATTINVKYSWNNGKPWLAIIDDGHGMAENELINAMKLGSKNPLEYRDSQDLGRYGLGLKTASFSQARKLTVISKCRGSLKGCEWDLNLIASSNNGTWNLGVLEQADIDTIELVKDIEDQGTLVLWQDLDRLDSFDQPLVREKKLGRLVSSTRKHTELTFHRYLSPTRKEKRVNILFNGSKLIAFNPFNPTNNATRELPEQKITFENESISVQPYVLPHYSKVSRDEYEKYAGESGYLQNQGFYVYRNKRLIIKNTWFRLIPREELTKLLRVQVDLPNTLDHLWRIDVKKANAFPPEAIRKQLKQIIFQIQYSGKQVYKQKGKRLRSSVTDPAWSRVHSSGKVSYEINKEHPLISQFKDDLQPNMQKKLGDILSLLEGCFPTELFYSDIARSPETMDKPKFQEQQFSNLLDSFITPMIESKIPSNDIVKRLLSIDPFASYPEEVTLLLNKKGYYNE